MLALVVMIAGLAPFAFGQYDPFRDFKQGMMQQQAPDPFGMYQPQYPMPQQQYQQQPMGYSTEPASFFEQPQPELPSHFLQPGQRPQLQWPGQAMQDEAAFIEETGKAQSHSLDSLLEEADHQQQELDAQLRDHDINVDDSEVDDEAEGSKTHVKIVSSLGDGCDLDDTDCVMLEKIKGDDTEETAYSSPEEEQFAKLHSQRVLVDKQIEDASEWVRRADSVAKVLGNKIDKVRRRLRKGKLLDSKLRSKESKVGKRVAKIHEARDRAEQLAKHTEMLKDLQTQALGMQRTLTQLNSQRSKLTAAIETERRAVESLTPRVVDI